MKFKGGYIFKRFEGAAQPILRELPIPERVYFPIPAALDITFSPAVQTGDRIQAGDRVIASPDGTALVSSVNGTVTKADNEGVAVESDGSSSFKPVEGHTREPWHMDREEVISLFRFTGCPFLLGERFISLTGCDRVKHIIISAVHNSPLNQSWTPEMFGDKSFLTGGLRVLKVLFPHADHIIGINASIKHFFDDQDIKDLARIVVLSNRYPQEHPVLLARDAAGVRSMSPAGDLDESVIVMDYSDVILIAEVMTQGRPLIDRIITMAGSGVSNPGWYRVRLGTPFETLKTRLFKGDHQGPWRIIRGNPLTGRVVENLDMPVSISDHEVSVISDRAERELFRFMRPGFAADSYSKTTIADILPIFPKKLETSVHGGVRPCVQCNFCDEVCPVDLYPFLIWKHVDIGATEESFRLRPFDCIECGLCNYVCPSKIEIMQAVVKAKEEFLSAGRPR